jgi:hypothetical protein
MRKTNSDPNTIFMNSKLVAKISKNRLEEIRISVLKNNKVDIRTYFYFPQENEPKPTKKGVMLSFKYIEQICGVLEKLVVSPDSAVDVSLEKNEKDELKIYAADYMGKKLVHIRTFYLRENELKPGKGIAFGIGLAKDILAALKESENFREK